MGKQKIWIHPGKVISKQVNTPSCPWLPCTLNVTLVDKDSVAIVHSHCHTSGHGVATTFKLTLGRQELVFFVFRNDMKCQIV